MNESSIDRRKFLKTAAVAAGTLVVRRAWGESMVPKHRQPNVLLIVADDQRGDTVGALGNKVISTPVLDRLVSQGFSFNHCRTMGSWTTGAVCVPSRAMIHTGRYLFRVPDNMGGFPTIGQVLQQNGYTAFGCGKWHNGSASFARSFNSGAHIFMGGMNFDQYKLHYYDYDPAGHYGKDSLKIAHQFSTDFYTDAAVEFLHGQKGEKPFFCYVAFTSPHDPRTPPPPFDKMYDPAAMPLPANWLPEHPFDNGDMHERDEKLAPMPRTKENTRQQLCDYYGMVSNQDAAVGRILKALHASGQAENTIIIYTGDHGLSIGSHGLFGKMNVYEGAVAVPCIMIGPGIPTGKSDCLCYGADLLPTLCELIGIAVPDTVDGHSLAPIISGYQRRVRDSAYNAFFHYTNTQEAIRDERWKLIRYNVAGKRISQLFDLQTDPAEINNLCTDAAASKQIPRLDAIRMQWETRWGRKTRRRKQSHHA